eukprot:XP_001694515.1 predicted protein [Chlamydomonas reinhardtii]
MGEAAGVAGAPGHAPAGASAAAGVMASARDADASCSTRVDSSCSTVGGADERRGGPAWEVRQASQARQEQLVSEVSSWLRVALARKLAGGAGPGSSGGAGSFSAAGGASSRTGSITIGHEDGGAAAGMLGGRERVTETKFQRISDVDDDTMESEAASEASHD